MLALSPTLITFLIFSGSPAFSKPILSNLGACNCLRDVCIFFNPPLKLRGGRASLSGSAAESFTEKDQHDLNRYVGIRERRKELKVELKQLQEEIDGLHEAQDEVKGMDEETAKATFKLNYPPALGFRWAETFTTWEPAAIFELLDYKLQLLEDQGHDMENDMQEMTENMVELHEKLSTRYAFIIRLILVQPAMSLPAF
jgi:hypothetical protein